jgi:LEA14-like dessication related protein
MNIKGGGAMGKRVSRGFSIFLNACGRAALFVAAAVLLGAAVFLASCSSLKTVFEGKVDKPRVSLVSKKIDRLSFVEADLLFDILVENPERRDVKLSGFDYALFIDEARFLEGARSLDAVIGPRSGTKVQLPLALRYEELFRAYAGLSDRENAKYRLELGFVFDHPALGETLVPLNADGEFPVLKKPSIKLASAGVSRLDFTEADLVLSFAVRNPNQISFTLDRFDFRLEVGGQSWAAGVMEKKAGIGASADTLVKVPVRVSTFFIGQSGYRQLLETRPLSYRISGTAAFSAPFTPPGGIDFPFDASGIADVTR